MNAEQRKDLDQARGEVEKAKETVERVKDDNQDAYDNMPEGLQGSAPGEAIQDAINTLEWVVENLDEAIDGLSSIE